MDFGAVDLLRSIYATITDDDAYARLPGLAAAYLTATSASFLDSNSAAQRVELAYNIGWDHVAAYERYYSRVDPFVKHFATAPPATSIAFGKLVSERDYERSEYYNDFVRPNRLAKYVAGACFHVRGTLIATTFHRTQGGAFEPADEERLGTILPHFQTIFEARAALAAAGKTMNLSEALFQDANDAVLLCDATQRVVHLNRAARGLPVACAVIGRDGRLAFKSSAAQTAFAGAVDHAARRRAATTFEISRHDKLPYRVEVSGTRTASPSVVVTILDIERQLQRRIARAQELYQFTPSECALVETLLRGRTPEDHAALRGTALSTVRSQLHILFAKSKTRRQGELIAAVTRLV